MIFYDLKLLVATGLLETGEHGTSFQDIPILLSGYRPVKANRDILWHHILEIFKERFSTGPGFSASDPGNCQRKV
jgi:hypothetical protein